MRKKELAWVSLHFDELEEYAGKLVAILIVSFDETSRKVILLKSGATGN